MIDLKSTTLPEYLPKKYDKDWHSRKKSNSRKGRIKKIRVKVIA